MNTVDESATAAIPGHLNISKNKYLDYVGLTGLQRIKYSLLFNLPSNFLFQKFGSNKYVFDFIQKTEQFKYGCVNPSIVLNKTTHLIATFTNLTAIGEEITPVIKITEEPLNLIKNTHIKNGQALASVALYYRNTENENARAWADFNPKLANCFTDNLKACNELLLKIKPNAWKCLELGLAQLKDQTKPGLFHVKLDKALVRNSY